MKVTYRANGEVREISDAGARQLIDAGICLAAEPSKEPAPKKDPPPKKSDKPTKVEPMTTEDTPFVPTKHIA